MVFLPHWPKIIGERPIDLGLERVNALLEVLGNPHHTIPPVVHVAGTNGKGSTIAFMRHCLEAAGYRVHVYTSPHILQFNERIVLAGKPISDHYLSEIMDECRIAAEKAQIDVTFFEGTTIGAYLAFSRVEADIVLLETGMGGRLDATNVIDAPALTVITPISLDHTEYLGNTLKEVAFEKAGIIKESVPVVVSLQEEEAFAMLAKTAEVRHAPVIAYEYDWGIERHSDGRMSYHCGEESVMLPEPGLKGVHQYINAATAYTALQQLSNQFPISQSAMEQGLAKAQWIGRLQKIESGACARLLTEDWELWVDGAHNASGAQMLGHVLDEWDDKPTYLICGFTRGRSPESILQYFVGKAEHVAGVLVQTEPSAINPERIAADAQALGFTASFYDYVDDAVADIMKRYETQGRILCCGSLYLISDVLSEDVSAASGY